jgi:tRNA(fMet)-specific endonuclease VapC
MILDSDILIALGRSRWRRHLADRLAGVRGPIYTTAINWGELWRGLRRLPPEEREPLSRRYEWDLLPLVGVLDYTRSCAEIYAEVRVELESRGQRLDEADLMIAAVALRHDMVLVTGNTRHFRRVPGLRLENWLEEAAD